jgi:hypothetical protein
VFAVIFEVEPDHGPAKEPESFLLLKRSLLGVDRFDRD